MIRCFFFNDTATTEIYTLSLHDALPIWFLLVGSSRASSAFMAGLARFGCRYGIALRRSNSVLRPRSEEHTSELQSRQYLVCRLLLEKKKQSSRCPSSAKHSGVMSTYRTS